MTARESLTTQAPQTGWAAERLGAWLAVSPASGLAPDGEPIELGVRRNAKRAHLLVSRLLGKHIPVPVGAVTAAGDALGKAVSAACANAGREGQVAVVGFAETATALGHAVSLSLAADGLATSYAHTTRTPQPAGVAAVRFLEEHSHAVDQLLVLSDALRAPDATVVLVDDEVSTGRSALNAIRALHAVAPRRRYALACLVDSRSGQQRRETADEVRALGAELVDVALYDATVDLPDDVLARAARLCAGAPDPAPPAGLPAPVERVAGRLSTAMAARGWDDGAEAAARAAAAACAARLDVARDQTTLVLGDEELMHVPQLVAAALGPQVRVSTTTRSPAVALDVPGYPLRTALRFAATDGTGRPAFAYNVAPSKRAEPGNAPGFDHIVLVTANPGDHGLADGAGLVAQLAASARVSVKVVSLGC